MNSFLSIFKSSLDKKSVFIEIEHCLINERLQLALFRNESVREL